MPRKVDKADRAIAKAVADRIERVCRICGCSEFDGCATPDGEGCSWTEATLCSTCAWIRECLRQYFEAAGGEETRGAPAIRDRMLIEFVGVQVNEVPTVVLATEDELRRMLVAGGDKCRPL